MSRHARRAAFMAALTLVASGCGSSASSVLTAPARTPLPTYVLAPSPAMRLQPTPRPSKVVVSVLPGSGNEVFPGHYVTKFEPALTLTIDHQVDMDCARGYRCRGDVNVNSPRWLDLEFGHDHPVEIHVMSFDQVYDPTRAGRRIDPPADLAAWISALPGVTVLARKPVEVGGVAAMQLDLRTGSEDVPFGPTGLADPSDLGFGAHQSHRVIVLSRAGSAIVIGLGTVDPADDNAVQLGIANDILQPIVDSIAWE